MRQTRTVVAVGVAPTPVLLEHLEARRLHDGSAPFGGERSVSDRGLWDAMFATQIAESRAAETATEHGAVPAGNEELNDDDDVYAPFELWMAAQAVAPAQGTVISATAAVVVGFDSVEAVPVEAPSETGAPTDDDIYAVFNGRPAAAALAPDASPIDQRPGPFGRAGPFEWIDISDSSGPDPQGPADLTASYIDLAELPLLA